MVYNWIIVIIGYIIQKKRIIKLIVFEKSLNHYNLYILEKIFNI